jgi:hypothetical protein
MPAQNLNRYSALLSSTEFTVCKTPSLAPASALRVNTLKIDLDTARATGRLNMAGRYSPCRFCGGLADQRQRGELSRTINIAPVSTICKTPPRCPPRCSTMPSSSLILAHHPVEDHHLAARIDDRA